MTATSFATSPFTVPIDPVLMKANRSGFDEAFAEHVLEGLSRPQKSVPSRYFYDAEGDRLFQAIMACPEYYLTDCELEIFERRGGDIGAALLDGRRFELIELGSGDGLKTGLLLDAIRERQQDWSYRPVDISENSLELLRRRLVPGRPWLDFRPIHGNYLDVLRDWRPNGARRAFMFLGSNLGNYPNAKAVAFLKLVRGAMSPGDALLIGLDLKKDPHVIRAAYDDAPGHTRKFNLNLLRRINRELGGDFDLEAFEHCPEYDAESGAARSYLRSSKDQTVRIEALGRSFRFEQGETIFTEVSQKYDRALIGNLTKAAGFAVKAVFNDSRRYFTDQVWVLDG